MFKKICLLCILAVPVAFLHAQTPVANAKKRTAAITINGTPGETAWEFTNSVTKTIIGSPNNSVTYAVLWDSANLYIAVKVADANKYNDSQNGWDDDAIEIYIDADNNGGTTYGVNDRQFIKEWNSSSITEKNNKTTNIQHAWANISNGYGMELRIPWSSIGISNPQPGLTIGFDVAIDDDDNAGVRESQLMWAGDGNNWQYPRNFGDLVLVSSDAQAPSAPANLAASNLTQSSLSLSWTASSDNTGVAGYDVYRNGVKINTSLVTSTTYNVTGLNAATAYQFYVRAKDVAGNTSGNSNTISITTPDTQAPTAASNLTATDLSQTSFTLTWTNATDNVGITGYDIYQDSVKINSSLVTANSFVVTGLNSNTTYSFYVQAYDAAGNVTNSSILSVTTLSPPETDAPTSPSNLTASNTTQSSVTLSWNASSDNVAVTGYDVYQNGTKVNTSPVSSTTYTATGLTALSTYEFYVVARDAAGNTSAASNTISATTPDTQAPSVPSGLAASNITATSLTLSWNASTDNVSVSGYDIYQNAVKINTEPVTVTSFNITGLSEATSYSFFIKAVDSSGNASASSTLNVATADAQAPAAPAGLTSSNITPASVNLSWTAATDNVGVTGYDVYRNLVKINSSVVTGTSYNVTGLTASTTYTFYVQARDAAGNVSESSDTINVSTAAAPSCTNAGAINYQRWNNITGVAVSNLTSAAGYPNSPSTSGTLTSFEIPSNTADNYGVRVYGYICPPVTGTYSFWIAGDDNCELWLSTNNSSANKQRIAYHTSWTNSQEWNKFSTQKSAVVTLTAGQLYYVEALIKEGTGGDHMAVGWAKPGQATTSPSEVIPGSQLITHIPDTETPTAPANLRAGNVMQTTVSLNWMAATDNVAVSGYDVYNSNNVKLNSSTITGLNYTVTGLTASTAYTFYVKAKDAAGNNSGNSNMLTVTTVMTKPALEAFSQRTVIANQRMPHDLVYGPDNNLWYIERFAGTVSYVNPATGAKTTVLSLGSNMVRGGGQDGLLGLALHPQFTQGKPYVYIAYTYQSTSATVRKTRIVRCTYDPVSRTLNQPVTILENIPGSNDHNSGRIAIGPDLKLYYTVGDMGSGQFDNRTRAQNAQNLNILEGKILRLNTEIVNSSWIPADNPFNSGGLPTAVYSLGHRNPQGLVWGNVNGTDILYSSEHGPYSDDELNIVERGRNYGWPLVAGFCDGNYNGRYIGGVLVTSEQNSCSTLNAREPLRSLFPAVTPPDSTTNNSGWPSTAPSGTDFYRSTAIPGWQNSLLVAQLKTGVISRFKLSSDGQYIISDTINYFRGKGRFRDVVVSADGLKIYVACDSSGSTSGPTGGVTSTPANPGSILEFTYQAPGGTSTTNQWINESKLSDAVADKRVDVYPNPATTYFVVYNHTAEKGWRIELVDVSGKLVKRQAALNTATRIETGDVANGLYILKITNAQGKVIRTEKVVIQK